MSTTKLFVTPNELQRDSYDLARQVYKSGYTPDFLVAIWRGGTPIGIHMHELFKWKGLRVDHIAIRTSRYTDIDMASDVVKVFNLGYLTENLRKSSKLLIVDDIFDTGLSIQAVIDALQTRLGNNMPLDVRVATLYYKPSKNQTQRIPNFYVHSTDEWVVFPHEVEGMTIKDIATFKGAEIGKIFSSIT